MRTHTMAQAKRDRELGHLARWRIVRTACRQRWSVELGDGAARGLLADARSRQPRQFATLDAAVSALEQIGFEVNKL